MKATKLFLYFLISTSILLSCKKKDDELKSNVINYTTIYNYDYKVLLDADK